jgi:hypothetical protein
VQSFTKLNNALTESEMQIERSMSKQKEVPSKNKNKISDNFSKDGANKWIRNDSISFKRQVIAVSGQPTEERKSKNSVELKS